METINEEKNPLAKDWTEKEYEQVQQIREIVRMYSIGTEGIWEICKFLRKEFPDPKLSSRMADLETENETLKAKQGDLQHYHELIIKMAYLEKSHRELLTGVKSLAAWGLEQSRKSLGHQEFKCEDQEDYSAYLAAISNAEHLIKGGNEQLTKGS